MITQQQAEDVLCEYTRAFDRDDPAAIAYQVNRLRMEIDHNHPEPNIIAWLIEYGDRVWDQLAWWRKNPHIPRPTPQPCEAFTPFQSTQIDGVRDIVKKQRKNATSKRQAIMT